VSDKDALKPPDTSRMEAVLAAVKATVVAAGGPCFAKVTSSGDCVGPDPQSNVWRAHGLPSAGAAAEGRPVRATINGPQRPPEA
jgi:hypothetical protein